MYSKLFNNMNSSRIGCRVHLNPNGSDLRCGDKVNNINWNPNEGVVQFCEICKLKNKNKELIEILNQKFTRSDII